MPGCRAVKFTWKAPHTGARTRGHNHIGRYGFQSSRGITGKELNYGGTCRPHAAIDRGWRPLRPPDPPLEPADEAVHLRRPPWPSHHRPVADRAAVRARTRLIRADCAFGRQGAVGRASVVKGKRVVARLK